MNQISSGSRPIYSITLNRILEFCSYIFGKGYLQDFLVAFLLTVISFLGILSAFRFIGEGTGGACIGLLFEALGPKPTLFYFAITTAVMLALFCVFVFLSKDRDDYHIVSGSET